MVSSLSPINTNAQATVKPSDMEAIAYAQPVGYQGVRQSEIRDVIKYLNENQQSNTYNPIGDRSYRLTQDNDPKTGKAKFGIETIIRDPAGILPDRVQYTEVYIKSDKIFIDPPKGDIMDANPAVPGDVRSRQVSSS
jgi:hypothetical protein